jgi:pyridoxal phosphate enzyme (YggS family)
MTSIAANLQAVKSAIRHAAQLAQRREETIGLVAVSKFFPVDAVREAFAVGQLSFGESYVQEALDKMAALQDLPLEWHFIGPIQSNKTRAIAENFSWVHSLDRLKIAERLALQRPLDLPPLNVCIQVNVSGEDSKSGLNENELETLVEAVEQMPQLKLRGLMAIPAPADLLAAQRLPFTRLRELFEHLNQQQHKLDTLSMGMSHDLQAAIVEGATLVRIGTAIFGQRN